MKTILEHISDATKELVLALLLLALLLGFTPKATAQIGTYVAPRVTTVFNQWVTNNNYTNAFVCTNWLNFQGWHNVNFILSEYGGTNNIGTNQVNLNIFGSPGAGNVYTNAAQGTNYWYTPNALLTWNNNITATKVYNGSWTNLTQNLGDGWQWFSGNISVVCTNTGSPLGGFWLQIDAVVTP